MTETARIGPPRQLLLDFGLEPSFAAEDYLVSTSNEAAFAAIRAWPDWLDRVLLLVGPAGSGKSHLAAIWAAAAGARFSGSPEVASWYRDRTSLVIEDCDRRQLSEQDLFHLLNAVRASEDRLLMTARILPAHWGLRTPDLLSRLRLAPTVEIAEPDEDLIKSVLVKLFADRQIAIAEDVVDYAARHLERSFAAVNRFVAAADEEALVAGRRITRPLAARMIDGQDSRS